MSFEIRSSRIRAEWRGDQTDRAVQRGAARGLALGAEHVRGAAVDNAPLDTGALRNSATASHDPDELTAAVSFDTPYAARQHEELDYHHRTGQAKYLETALNTNHDTIARLVQAQIRKALGS